MRCFKKIKGIKPKDFYTPLYELLEDVTPLKKDCGVLCDAVCCKDGKDGETGMLLFPNEVKMFKGKRFAKIVKSNCEYGEKATAKLLICKGKCDRSLRPLACRIFPLLPYRHIGEGKKLEIIMDPRAKGMCPLARSLKVEQLEPEFIEKVTKVCTQILKLKDGAEYIDMLSDLADQSDFLKQRA